MLPPSHWKMLLPTLPVTSPPPPAAGTASCGIPSTTVLIFLRRHTLASSGTTGGWAPVFLVLQLHAELQPATSEGSSGWLAGWQNGSSGWPAAWLATATFQCLLTVQLRVWRACHALPSHSSAGFWVPAHSCAPLSCADRQQHVIAILLFYLGFSARAASGGLQKPWCKALHAGVHVLTLASMPQHECQLALSCARHCPPLLACPPCLPIMFSCCCSTCGGLVSGSARLLQQHEELSQVSTCLRMSPLGIEAWQHTAAAEQGAPPCVVKLAVAPNRPEP